jgi:hypothetical protein
MKSLMLTLATSLLLPALVFGGEKEDVYFKEKMIPLAQDFLQRIGVTNCLPLGTNQVHKHKVDFFEDRPGCTAVMALSNRITFRFITEKQKSEVWSFQSGVITYYNLVNVPKEKIEAVKALNLRNKLSPTNALALAEKYFKLLGHKDENFHPPELIQSYWSGGEDAHGGILPYYEVSWYRKDVNLADRDKGISVLPEVKMTVSGTDFSLIHYSKHFMPIGGDF